jgi:DNA-binding transcriptional LysR family regulator
MQLTDRFVSLLEEHVDFAVRVGELPDSSMIGTRVGLIRLRTIGILSSARPGGRSKRRLGSP